MSLINAKQTFHFRTQLTLVELTGLKAADLAELLSRLKEVPDSSIYFHTHHFIKQHQFLTPEPPNDFAYWVTTVLQEDLVGERLAAMDTVRFASLKDLRAAIIRTIEPYVTSERILRKAPPGEEFFFLKSILFTGETSYKARNLKEFLEGLKKVSIYSLYHHIFEAILRQPIGTNDFSYWLSTQLNEKSVAASIEKLDPYTHTMEGLRQRIIRLIEKRLMEVPDAQIA